MINPKVKKALKLLNLVNRSTGNPHLDDLAKRTFDDYTAKHGIDAKELQNLQNISVIIPFENLCSSELYFMIATGHAEDKNLLKETQIKYGPNGCQYDGPKFLYDEIEVKFAKYYRKYQITRDEIKRKLDNENKMDGLTSYQVVGINGSSITIMGNMVAQSVKYSEQAFYNAFIIKYELIPRCVVKRVREMNSQQQGPPKEQVNQNDINQIFHMFHKESLNDQLDS